MDRVILHVDMDAFFASVEQVDDPSLQGKPVVVGAPADQRGVVAAASYAARQFGIHSAMPSREAARRCPKAIFLPPRMPRYKAASQQIFEIFERFTPLVEVLSVDEAFLDVTGSKALFGSGVEIADAIRRTIRNETGLTASVGVAPNKFLAKLASDMDKPDGCTLVPFARDAIVEFLAPLPISRVWGVGAVTQQRLEAAGIQTIGDVQRVAQQILVGVVGEHSAGHLMLLAYGEDAREIEPDQVEKSISKEHTFAKDVKRREPLERTLLALVDEVGTRLRDKERYAGVIRLKLRWQGFKTITRQRQLRPPCCDAFSLRNAAMALLAHEAITLPVRLIGVGVSGLCDRPPAQLGLFEDTTMPGREKKEVLSRSVDRLRAKYGASAIGRAARDSDAETNRNY